jgi:uncharacterized protein (TIGR02145 family)
MKKNVLIIALSFSFATLIFSCNKESSVEDATKTACDSLKQGLLKPNASDTLRLLSCIKISYCDSIRLGLLKFNQDLRSLDCNSIIIGSQKWMTKNLDVITYSNGDTIPQVTDKNQWSTLTTGAWCYYNNDSNNNAIYGKLYNAPALVYLAPKGTHIATKEEWVNLINLSGGVTVGGIKLKSKKFWIKDQLNSDEYNFSAIPGGLVDFWGHFANLGFIGYYWANELDRFSLARGQYSFSAVRIHSGSGLIDYTKNYATGMSVRLVKDY